jgi:hypothetical protein
MDKKAISDALKEAMNKEDLNTRAAAKALNLNPCYVSMAQNPKSWDAMGKTPWIRLEEWFLTRGSISSFEIPDGEDIWKPKEKAQDAPKKDVSKHSAGEKRKIAEYDPKKLNEEKEVEEHSPENSDFLTAIDKINEATEFIVKTVIPESMKHDPLKLKLALDIEINLTINGQKVHLQ